MEPDQVVEGIKRKILDDSTIEGRAHILVFAQKNGVWPFRKVEIRLTGIVHQESDRKKAEEYASHDAGEIPVVNEIEVVDKK